MNVVSGLRFIFPHSGTDLAARQAGLRRFTQISCAYNKQT
jgi:hypothetical protein